MLKIGQTPEDTGFYKTVYIHEQNNQPYPEYILNEKGFSLLAMGFTGKKALIWKSRYIDAFQLMRKKIIENAVVATPSYQIEDPIARAREWIKEQEEKSTIYSESN